MAYHDLTRGTAFVCPHRIELRQWVSEVSQDAVFMLSGLEICSEARSKAGKKICLWWTRQACRDPEPLCRGSDTLRPCKTWYVPSDKSLSRIWWVNTSFLCGYTQKREVILTSTTFELMHNKMQSMHQAKIYFENIIIVHHFARIFQRCMLLPPIFQTVPSLLK